MIANIVNMTLFDWAVFAVVVIGAVIVWIGLTAPTTRHHHRKH